jgi:hypothetical protein
LQAGGIGGGGAGGPAGSYSAGTVGTDGLGGGGGGAGNWTSSGETNGARGGSGIVVVRYPLEVL